MAPFRWPSLKNDIALAKEVASRKPQTHQEWDELATILSEVFSSDSNRVELKGRGCRERLTRHNSPVLSHADLKSQIWADG